MDDLVEIFGKRPWASRSEEIMADNVKPEDTPATDEQPSEDKDENWEDSLDNTVVNA